MDVFKTSSRDVRRSSGAHPKAVTVSRSRTIAASPAAIFAVLSDPARLAGVLPRVTQVEVIERGASSARVVAHMRLTPFNALRAEGEVRWLQDREIAFATRHPVAVETRLLLCPEDGGTRLDATLTLDLTPLMGPLAALVPHDQVARAAAPDLEATLQAIARASEHR